MNKKLHIIVRFCMAMTFLMSIASCGLIDPDFDETLRYDYGMQLDYDSVYVMEGDTFSLHPVFTPWMQSETGVFWKVSDDILRVDDNSIIATRPGNATVEAISIIQGLESYCNVTVMPEWAADPYKYTDEMFIYARVTVDGKDFNPSTMKIGAFVDGECRGVGEVKEHSGIRYVCMRIWGNMYDSSGNMEIVRLRIYIKGGDVPICEYIQSSSMFFDGMTHGTLSNLESIECYTSY